MTEPVLSRLLTLAGADAERLLARVAVPPKLAAEPGPEASRALIAMALNLLLLDDLAERVPTGAAYLADLARTGERLVFDHGALRTVDLVGMGELPAGETAITRILGPLGYVQMDTYPLEPLRMTGRSYAQADHPQDLPQFFVSELHPTRFSPEFQAAVARVTAHSNDPLDSTDLAQLATLDARGALPVAEAAALLPQLVAAFARQHGPPSLADYDLLAAESREMAWIATEGNAFNHATARVADLDALVAEQRRLHRPLKDIIEVSRSGRVRQTAFKADPVMRSFVEAGGDLVHREVPGSFFEFIQRAEIDDEATGARRLDLAFDSGNAQGIFKMTAAV